MSYHVIDDYYRQEHFDFFRSQYTSPFYGLTWNLEIGRLREFCAENGYSSYLALCYYFTRAMAEVEDFRYRVRDESIVLYDELHPGATVRAPGGLFSFLYLRYQADVTGFMRDAEARKKAAEETASLTESDRQNYIFFTAVPGVQFTSFEHVRPASPVVAEPRVAFGRFFDEGGQTSVPVGILINHIFIDGSALGHLAERVEHWLNHPDEALPRASDPGSDS